MWKSLLGLAVVMGLLIAGEAISVGTNSVPRTRLHA